MASTYYDSSGKSVIDGDIAYAADLNDINSAVDTALQQVETDITAIAVNQPYYSNLAQKWAEEVEDTPVTVGHYSALHWAAKAEDQAILADADRVQTNADRVATAADRVNTNNDKIATAADRVQTGLDRVATAADRIQTGLDAATTAQDVIDTQALVNAFPTLASGDEGKYLKVDNPFSNGWTLGYSGLELNTSENASFAAESQKRYPVNTTGGAVTATLPAAPVDGDMIGFFDLSSSFQTNSLTISRNGKTIMGVAENMTVSTRNASFSLMYISSTGDWRIIDATVI